MPSWLNLSEADRVGALSLAQWWAIRRANQTPPDGDWSTWLVQAGRGFGKTRVGAEWVKEAALLNPGWRIAVVAPTYADARDTCIEGDSGLRSVVPGELVDQWNRSLGEFRFTNGSLVKLFSADEPDRMRGPQHHAAWCDEVAAWRYADAWDQLMFGLRLGASPKVVATTTPRPVPLIKALLADPGTVVTRGSTFDNAANLAPAALAKLRATYEGTRLGRQELYAELLDDVVGALWTRAMMDAATRADPVVPDRIVVGVDPPAGEDGDSAECGIVVAGRIGQGITSRAVVLADHSMRGSPMEWGRAVVSAYHEAAADRIVVEVNQGGAMVAAVLRTVDPTVPIREVRAAKAKRTRAEPVAALYEQGRVSHAGVFAALEDQLCGWAPDTGQASPDRMDALVWALTDLMLGHVGDPSIRRL